MSHVDLQGWFADPFGLHEQRYFSAGRPTKLVRTGRVESFDEPPSATYEPTAAPGPGDTAVFDPALGADLAGPGGPAVPSYGDPDRPRHARRARPPRRHLSFTTIYTVSAVTIIAIVATVYFTRPRDTSGPASTADIAFVTRSAEHTLAQQTAQMSMAGTVEAEGQSVSVSGTGEFNFGTHSAELTEIISAAGHGANMTFIETGGNAYFQMSIDGKSLTQLGGQAWVQVPVRSSSQASVTGGNPQSALLLLEQHGGTVRTLGKKTIGGVTCTGYSVTPSRQAMAAVAHKEAVALKLPASAADAASNAERPTITIWLDGHGLLRQMTASIQIGGLPGSDAAAAASLTMNFSHYGAPVRIAAPPAADVNPFQSFLQAAGHTPI